MVYQLTGNELLDFAKPQHIDQRTNDGRTAIHFAPTPGGDLSFETQSLSDQLYLIQGRYAIKDDLMIAGAGDDQLLEIQINLSEQAISYLDHKEQLKHSPAHSANLSYLAADDNKAKLLLQSDKRYETFDIHLPLEILQRYAGTSEHIDRLLENIHHQRSAQFSSYALPLSPSLLTVIEQIRHCPFEGATKQLFLDAKVYEIMALLHAQVAQPEEARMDNKTREQLYEAKALICAHIDQPMTIAALAKNVGTNQTKLKKEFKEAFGQTIFEFLQEHRMQKAKSYLLDTSLSIQEVSLLVGYGSSSNFSIAFKNYFGHTPGELRKS